METNTRRKPIVDQIFGDNKAPIHEVLTADFDELRAEIDAHVEKMREAAKTPPKTDEEQAAHGKLILDGAAIMRRADGLREVEKKPILDAGRALDGFFKDMQAALLKGRDYLQGQANAYAREKEAAERARKSREAEEHRKKEAEALAKAEAAKSAAGAASAEARAESAARKAEEAEAAAAASAAELTKARVGGVTASAKGAWVASITDYQTAIAPLGAVGMFIKREALESAFNSMAKTQKDGAAWPGVLFRQDTKATFR